VDVKYKLAESAINLGLCSSVNPLGTNKEFDHGYLSNVYDLIVNQRKITSLLEIGLMYGNSLRLWSQVLSLKTCIGIENGATVSQSDFADSQGKIRIIKGDAFRKSIHKGIKQKLDLVIDDSNHTLYQQSQATRIYFDKLSREGVIVIEDVNPGLKFVNNILRSIPPFFKVDIFVVDLTSLPRKLHNSKCVVIAKKNNQTLRLVGNDFWFQVNQNSVPIRIFQYMIQKTFLCPYWRIKTSVSYRVGLLLSKFKFRYFRASS
jgi:hypothetical protein